MRQYLNHFDVYIWCFLLTAYWYFKYVHQSMIVVLGRALVTVHLRKWCADLSKRVRKEWINGTNSTRNSPGVITVDGCVLGHPVAYMAIDCQIDWFRFSCMDVVGRIAPKKSAPFEVKRVYIFADLRVLRSHSYQPFRVKNCRQSINQ